MAVEASRTLGWVGIMRFGLVQTALGAIVVLTTSTMNRVMKVELGLPALLPGALIALHYAVQIFRPRFGYGSDVGGARTPWIIVGMAVLALGAVGAAVATALMGSYLALGVAVAALSFILIGIGVGVSGTTLLALLAKSVLAERRAAAATIVWLMMIAGFVLTTVIAGHLLDPFSVTRLVVITAGVAGIAFVVSVVALWGVERGLGVPADAAAAKAHPPFKAALADAWAEPQARLLAIFVFVAMLGYSSEELVLDPFAGEVFGFTPGESTKLSGALHGGVFLGMAAVAIAGSTGLRRWIGSLHSWMLGGTLASAAALMALASVALAAAGHSALVLPLRPTVFLLGVANGAFSIAAIGTMMGMAGGGKGRQEGVRMGLWGAAQGVAFGLGGLFGSGASDLARALIASPALAYACVFAAEAALFFVAAAVAVRLQRVAQFGAAPASATARRIATVT